MVPAIQPIVQQLYVFQREPGWVMPKGERDFTDAERRRLAKRWRRAGWTVASLRYSLEKNLWGAAIYRPGTKAATPAREQTCLDYIAREFADRPDLREGGHPDLPLPGQAAGLRQHLLPRPEAGQRGAGPEAVSWVTPRASSTPTAWSGPSTSS